MLEKYHHGLKPVEQIVRTANLIWFTQLDRQFSIILTLHAMIDQHVFFFIFNNVYTLDTYFNLLFYLNPNQF